MFQDERFSLFVTQGLERPVDLLPDLRPLRSLLGETPLGREGSAHLERNLAPGATFQMILAQVHGDAEEPAPDPLRVAAPIEVAIPLDERVLHDIGGIVGPSGHAFRVAVERVLVTSDQDRERLRISGENGAHDIAIPRLITGNSPLRADPGDVLLFSNKTTSKLGASPERNGRSGPHGSLAELRGQDYLRRMSPPLEPIRSRTLEDLPTPALLLDADILEGNLRSMQERADSLGVRLRPHIKTHKCLEIGRRQRELGGRGITVSTLEEAWIFSADGFDDITWAFPLNPSRIEEVRALAEKIGLGITVDDEAAVQALEDAGRPFRVWLKVDCGYGRAGVDPSGERAVGLARRIADSSRLELAGCLTHSGHAYRASNAEEARRIAESERRTMVEFGQRLRAAGVSPGTLSVGSTPAMSRVVSLDGVDEARPGNYALYDYTQVRLGSCETVSCAVSVLATVVSARPGADRCVTDAGALVLSKDMGPDSPAHYGRPFRDPAARELDPDSRVVGVSQEHGVLSGSRRVGEKVRILPNHSCLTVAQFDHFTVLKGNQVMDFWKIWRARGPLSPPGDGFGTV